jgi:tRNA threonylcarbamoyladenosine biosynthesis protein TsaE
MAEGSKQEFVTRSAEETIALGRKIAAQIGPPLLVLLSGDLGAGKTTLTKGIASGLGAAKEEDVTSPTFTLVHKYEGAQRAYHVDLYRIGDAHDFDTLGLEDVFDERAVVLVEWPDRMKLRTGWPVMRIDLEHVDESARRITVTGP